MGCGISARALRKLTDIAEGVAVETEKKNGAGRVLVVDTDPNTHFCVTKIFAPVDDFKLVGNFSNADEASNNLARLQPNIMLLGVELPRLNRKFIGRFKRIIIGLKIIIVTGLANADLIESLQNAGVDSCLTKPMTAQQCLATLRFVACRQIKADFRMPQPEGNVSRGATSKSGLPLSRREHEVLDGLAEGLLYKEIADRLGISFSAVHKHQNRLYQKLNVSNRSEAIRRWLQSTTTGRVSKPPSPGSAEG